MTLEQLKSELKEKEKGCGTSITIGISYSYCGFQNRCFCDKCQAEISALKKGISACEEILNQSQQKMNGERFVDDEQEQGLEQEVGSLETLSSNKKSDDNPTPVLFDDQLIECAKNNFQKGKEQERKRILEIIDKWETKQPIDQKYKMEKKGIFYNIYNVSELNLQELKEQLTTEGEGKK